MSVGAVAELVPAAYRAVAAGYRAGAVLIAPADRDSECEFLVSAAVFEALADECADGAGPLVDRRPIVRVVTGGAS